VDTLVHCHFTGLKGSNSIFQGLPKARLASFWGVAKASLCLANSLSWGGSPQSPSAKAIPQGQFSRLYAFKLK